MIEIGIFLLALVAFLCLVVFFSVVEFKKYESDQKKLKELGRQFDETVEALIGGE